MFMETRNSLKREIKQLIKLGVPEHSIKMIEFQIEYAVNKRECGKTLSTPEERKKAYQRALNEIVFACNLCHFARRAYE